MTRQMNPNDMMRSSMVLTRLMWQAQMVVAMRLMGMAGLWSVPESEDQVMAAEKPEAFMKAAMAAAAATMAGKRPDQIMNIWAGTLGRRTGSNYRRLSKRGPKL